MKERRGRVFPWVDRHDVYRWLNKFCDETVGLYFRPHMARVEYASQLNEAACAEVIASSCTWKGGAGGTRAIERYTRTTRRWRAPPRAGRPGGKRRGRGFKWGPARK